MTTKYFFLNNTKIKKIMNFSHRAETKVNGFRTLNLAWQTPTPRNHLLYRYWKCRRLVCKCGLDNTLDSDKSINVVAVWEMFALPLARLSSNKPPQAFSLFQPSSMAHSLSAGEGFYLALPPPPPPPPPLRKSTRLRAPRVSTRVLSTVNAATPP